MTPSRVLFLVATVAFALAGFGAHVGSLSELDLDSFGLAFFAAGHLV